MDLHIIGAEPTTEERDAIDQLLGPPPSRWDGGARDNRRDSRVARTGLAEVRDRRDLLLPAFHAVQDRIGWVSRGALNYICQRLIVPPAEAWGVLTFYHLFNTKPTAATVVHVCDDIACRLKGAEDLLRRGAASLPPGALAQAEGTDVRWQRSPCLGQCDRAPAALTIRAGKQAVREIMVAPGPEHIVGDKLLRRVGKADPSSLASYRAHGGFESLTRAFEIGSAAVIGEVITSNLLGRGGAAFPTGRKWEAVAREPAKPHYLVCNADESEPGTFKDRVLMEHDPFAIIEAMTIAAFAAGCAEGFIYVRGEYPLASERMEQAIVAARANGLLGRDIQRSGLDFDIEIRRGAGAYICGEETALFNSLEGRRGEPRAKPPFPAQVGLFGRPTVVNNVETLVNVLDIVREGGKTWAGVGTRQSTGTRLFCLSGHVAQPGLYEMPFGCTLGELVAKAGGVANGRPLQAILLGGAAGTFVGPDALSLRLTFEDVRAAGATLGSGVVMLFDDTVHLSDTLLRIAKFMEDESCGQCVPCRVGTVRQVEILERLCGGGATAAKSALAPDARSGAGSTVPDRDTDLALLNELGQCMRDASICGLGQTASSAIETAIARLNVFP